VRPTGATTGRLRASKPVVAPAEDPAPTPAPRTPDDLLAEANAARAAHRWRDADALYARVASGEPAGLAAQAALVASATIHLEHLGDPAGAARRFRAALASGPRDALAEDARWGLAEAARATGDSAAELRALDDFIAHHAGSPRAPRAGARRTEIGAAR
jgi:outer membrane protein assembly factor BamD (BamD/ComL family)